MKKLHGRQIFCAVVVSGCSLFEGYVFAWPNLLVDLMPPHQVSDSDLLSNNTDFTTEVPVPSLQLTQDDVGLLAALPSLVCIMLFTSPSILINLLGLKGVEATGIFLAIISLLLMAFLPSKVMFYVGRVTMGIFVILITVITQLWVSELVAPEIRGVLSSLPRFMVSLGMLQMLVFAPYLSLNMATAMGAMILVPVLCLLIYVPESPYWLVKKGRREAAIEALTFLQVPKDKVGDLLEEIESCVRVDSKEMGFLQQIRQLKSPNNFKPLILMLTICSLKGANGNAIVISYSTYLFDMAGVELDPHTCSIFVGLTRILAMMVGAYIIESLGRRPLLIGSALLCALLLTITSCILSTGINPSWVVVVPVILYVVATSAGCNVLPYVLIGEVIPSAIQAVGCLLCLEFFELFYSIFTWATPEMLRVVGLDYLFLIPAGANVLMALVAWLWLPETQGRTLCDTRTSFGTQKDKNEV